jgi:hypothetical protein
MDDYLKALAKRDPGRLRVMPDIRSTEDSQALPLGSGIWRTVKRVHQGGQYFVDEETGHVEYWGVVDEMGQEAILSVRLKVSGLLISEVETIVTRGPGDYFDPAFILKDAKTGFHRVLQPEERSSWEDLIRAANLYFGTIELSYGDLVPVIGDCRRYVNGTLDSLDDANRLSEENRFRSLGIVEQINDRHYAYIESLRCRRFPIVDEARGVVVCHLLFDHPGDQARADGSLPFRYPNSMLFTEAFKVASGTIEEIWALGSSAMP